MECLFCRIAEGTLPGDVVYKDAGQVAFKDIHPQAPVHILIIPKKHISGIEEIHAQNAPVVSDLILTAKKIAAEHNLDQRGYRLVINCKSEGGQTVDHLHLHLLGGRKMTWPPG